MLISFVSHFCLLELVLRKINLSLSNRLSESFCTNIHTIPPLISFLSSPTNCERLHRFAYIIIRVICIVTEVNKELPVYSKYKFEKIKINK